ncbi:MAG: glycoside hydrolase family 127 protein [Planctomycetes bacterium]|nr:glycoside hydrolase family 127 protein [Planctomycetota bacterium]
MLPALAAALLSLALLPPQDPLLPSSGRLVPVPAAEVQFAADSFWGPRLATNAEASLLHGAAMLEQHGQFGNFRMAAAALGHPVPGGVAPPAEYAGIHFYDSDAYKWLEAVCLVLEQPPPAGLDPARAEALRAELRARAERFVEEIAAAQRDDGYIQTQYVVKGQQPWSNLRDDHELYCAGHLMQAAVAHHRATGSRRLLDVALRFADLIDRTFGPDAAAGERPGACGHPEIETALVQLADHTGERRWLDLAACFLDARGHGLLGGSDYHQDHRPVREQRDAVGHAVRQLYLASGALGVAARTGDAGLLDANLAIWDDIVRGKLYVTGGLGARPDGEAFGAPFELPNERAYSETCASIAWMRWNHELLQATGAAKYADALETTLYNAFLAAVGQDGKSFFYVNPLESRGGHVRQPWFWCACCPPNVMRTFAGLPGWVASTTSDTLWIHLYDDCVIDAVLGDGRRVKVRVETDWPWEGKVKVTLLDAPRGDLNVALRIPAFVGGIRNESETIPGMQDAARLARRTAGSAEYALVRTSLVNPPASLGYADVFAWSTSLEPRVLLADPRVSTNAGLGAVARGPLVQAFESRDQGAALDALRLDVPLQTGLCAGFVPRTLRVAAVAVSRDGEALYAPLDEAPRAATALAIPYHAWAQRGDAAMRVWMPVVTHAPDFSDDAAFLREHADVLVLRAEGAGPVAVSRQLSARVMTSAFAEDEPGFGLVGRDAIRAGPVERGFANYGGEDRLWLSPEGGPHALFFAPGAEQVPDNWSVPRGMDGGPRSLVVHDARSARFSDLIDIDVPGHGVRSVKVDRTLEALSRADVAARLGRPLPEALRLVAFRSVNTLSWRDAPPAGALLGPWVLGQFVPGDSTHVIFPFRGDAAGPGASPEEAARAAIKRDYFGVVPDERLTLFFPPAPGARGFARFLADGRLRSKIGLARGAATGWIGAFDEDGDVLTLVQHSLPPAGAAVPDCDWRVPNPRATDGDVATSYNHGGTPRFFELESLGAALPAVAGATVTHEHVTIHLGGPREALQDLARAVLAAEF